MDTFTPPHCTNPDCPKHCDPTNWKFQKFGTFTRTRCQPAVIQRYRCCHCRRTFSTQTFDCSYWLRSAGHLHRIFHGLIACSGLRQIATEIGLAPATVQRLTSRLGRHCLLYQERHRPVPRETLVLDGFESFEFSQYHPFHFNALVGAHSQFFYHFTDSPLRRKGSMTAAQKLRREALEAAHGRPDPKALRHGVREVLALSLPEPAAITLLTDNHKTYPRALKELAHLEITHHVTSSKKRRTTSNPLFPVNHLDLLIRHSGANHKRETIAFSKRRQGAIERLFAFQVWKNFLRPQWVKGHEPTPAQILKIRATPLTLAELFGKRLFATHQRLPELLERYYRRQVLTPALGVNAEHKLRYAF